jgi:Domain of unknown function (DUF4338)
MNAAGLVQGRFVGQQEIELIQQLLTDYPHWSRYQLSRNLCQVWNWRSPDGHLKDMAARTLLLKLEQRGHIRLPAKRWASPNRMRHKRVLPIDHATEFICGTLADLAPLEICEVSQSPQELGLYEWLLHRYHYLSYTSSVGLNLKYLVYDRQRRPVSCLLFGSAAWKCARRDQFIGWTAPTRQAHLQEITNNTRFLILPWVQVPHLASQVLNQVGQQLRQDWQSKYTRPLHLVETFVDTLRFTGVCYRAANWIYLGQTTGRTRQDRWYQIQAPPKQILVCPLTPDFRHHLTR